MIYKNCLKLFLLSFALCSFSLFSVSAATIDERGFGESLDQVSNVSGYVNVDNPQEKLNLYIAVVIGWTAFMGINMMIQVILGGYEYMTAHDNAEKVLAAKKRIRNVIYAAIILVSGYVIVAAFVGIFNVITGYKI